MTSEWLAHWLNGSVTTRSKQCSKNYDAWWPSKKIWNCHNHQKELLFNDPQEWNSFSPNVKQVIRNVWGRSLFSFVVAFDVNLQTTFKVNLPRNYIAAFFPLYIQFIIFRFPFLKLFVSFTGNPWGVRYWELENQWR